MRVRVEFTRVDDELVLPLFRPDPRLSADEELRWTSPSEEQSASATSRARSSPTASRHERLLALERSGDWFDAALWSELARAGLSALAIPEAHGGGGLGMLELCALLEELGRHAAPVPLLATAVLGALPIARVRHAPSSASAGCARSPSRRRVLSAALVEYASSEPGAPRTPRSAGRRAGGSTARSTACPPRTSRA